MRGYIMDSPSVLSSPFLSNGIIVMAIISDSHNNLTRKYGVMGNNMPFSGLASNQ